MYSSTRRLESLIGYVAMPTGLPVVASFLKMSFTLCSASAPPAKRAARRAVAMRLRSSVDCTTPATVWPSVGRRSRFHVASSISPLVWFEVIRPSIIRCAVA